jgi:hypothetical protein
LQARIAPARRSYSRIFCFDQVHAFMCSLCRFFNAAGYLRSEL